MCVWRLPAFSVVGTGFLEGGMKRKTSVFSVKCSAARFFRCTKLCFDPKLRIKNMLVLPSYVNISLSSIVASQKL